MSKQTFQPRIARNYHNLNPGRFHDFNQRISTTLTDNSKIPESVWGANPTLLQTYLSASQKYDAVFHSASYGSRLDIAERDLLQGQLVLYLDEIALLLEAAAVRNPEVLPFSGFDLTKERRSHGRAKVPLAASEDLAASKHE